MLTPGQLHLLSAPLQVASKLHRQQIIRAIKRIILGFGEMPSLPLVSSPRLLLPACQQPSRPLLTTH